MAISEIMYKPAPRGDSNNLEFIEVYNSNPWAYDIGGYQIVADNLTYAFASGTTIASNGFLVVAASPQSMQSVYGLTNVLGPYVGSLKKAGTIRLLDEMSAVLLTVPYSNVSPWPAAADGAGHSLVLSNPSYGEGDPRAWDISDAIGGSPGSADPYVASPLRSVVINEFLAHTDLPDVDYVELYNHGNQAADISGCFLSDSAATNKFRVPPGTIIPAGGFISYTENELSFGLSAAGETIYFKNPTETRMLDAVHFEAQERGVAMGRWPDGASEFYRLTAKTPGTNNASIRVEDVVLNELMYNPISGNDDDQYVELYNRGTNLVNLSGWQLADAVRFTFPSATYLAPDGYLVVGRNAGRLLTHYPGLNLGNCIGNFAGKLSHNGQRLALSKPDSLISTNASGQPITNNVQIVVTEVTYGVGGRWGQWANGGGSSLELIDPQANPRLAANWADSDETQKSSWTNIEATGVLDNGASYDFFIDYAQVGLLDVGECLVDQIEVRAGIDGTNLVMNPDFETGLDNWSLQGCMVRSSLESLGSGYSGGHCLHVRCSSRLWTGVNCCQVGLNTNSMALGDVATLRFKARWLRGWPEVIMRLSGNWLEATAPMPIPPNLGTPGARNSRLVANSGPAIFEVRHVPGLPLAGHAVAVTAKVHDSDGVKSFTLFYRLDPSTNYSSVMMQDDGTGGDVLAGDGIWTATIPAQEGGQIIAFFLAATDLQDHTTRFPALSDDQAPVRECVVRFGDDNPSSLFGAYHFWITQTNVQRWANLPNLSNESHDGTFVTGNRVIYNVSGRFGGSPYHQIFDTPDGALCFYKWTFPEDDRLLGVTSFNKLHQPGDAPGNDASQQREQLANTLLRTLGVPWLNRRYVAVYVNGNRRGVLMEDAQCPDSEFIKEHFPNDSNGHLYKMQPWFEFAPFPVGSYLPFGMVSWCDLMPRLTEGGLKKPAAYRYNYEIRHTADSASNFDPVFALQDAANGFGTPDYVASLESLADMENWMRVFAANHAIGNADVFGSLNGQNLFGYVGSQGTKYSLLMWDMNEIMDNFGWPPGEELFTVNPSDLNLANLFLEPTFRRMYLRALKELLSGPLDVSRSGPMLEAKYAAFLADGLAVEDPRGAIEPWLTQARQSISTQVAAEETPTFWVNPTVVISNNIAFLTGTAPLEVKTVWVNGREYPVFWLSTTTFQIAVPLGLGTNQLVITGVDMRRQMVPGASVNVTVTYVGSVPSPAGQIVINEIMFSPLDPLAQYVELYNTSSQFTYDLSGWEFHGLAYTFPPGSVMGPTNFLLLAANREAFAETYGAMIPVFDVFNGTLRADGETLSLVVPGTNATDSLVVAQVRYSSHLPWPQAAVSTGSSLQLVDPTRDNWRLANWAAAYPPAALSPGMPNTQTETLSPFPTLWLNEIQAENLTGITNRFGQRGPWIEIYNGGSNAVTLSGLYLSTNYSNLLQWGFPAGASVGPKQFAVIFADGQPALSTPTELHTSFVLPPGAGAVALSRVYNGHPQVLDYLDYTNLQPNHAYGSSPDGQAFARQEFVYPTPGATNNGASAPMNVVFNEWMAANTRTIVNPINDKFSDWFELFNAGTNEASLGGYYLSDSLTNRFKFQIPQGYRIQPGEFLLVWADGKLTNGTADLHISFKLNKAGESLGLFGADGNAVDFLVYGAQTNDISQGRYPDGSSSLAFMPQPTPRTNNVVPNTAPILPAQPGEIIPELATLVVINTATDADIPPNALSYALVNPPQNAYISAEGIITWTPSQTQSPSTNFFVTVVTDNGSPPMSATNVFAVVVMEVNQPPVLAVLPDLVIPELSPMSVTNSATEPNIHSVTVGYGLLNPPAGARIDEAGVITWTPTEAQGPSTNLITEVATNANPYDVESPFLTATSSFTVIVREVNHAPSLAPIGDRIMLLGDSLEFTAYGVDPDLPPQPLTFTIGAPVPPGASIDAATGEFNWRPATAPSTNRLSIVVTDDPGTLMSLSATQYFRVTVLPPPTLTDPEIHDQLFSFSWPSLTGRLYQVEAKRDLTEPLWMPLGGAITGIGDSLGFTNPVEGGGFRFFRVRVAP